MTWQRFGVIWWLSYPLWIESALVISGNRHFWNRVEPLLTPCLWERFSVERRFQRIRFVRAQWANHSHERYLHLATKDKLPTEVCPSYWIEEKFQGLNSGKRAHWLGILAYRSQCSYEVSWVDDWIDWVLLCPLDMNNFQKRCKKYSQYYP